MKTGVGDVNGLIGEEREVGIELGEDCVCDCGWRKLGLVKDERVIVVGEPVVGEEGGGGAKIVLLRCPASLIVGVT